MTGNRVQFGAVLVACLLVASVLAPTVGVAAAAGDASTVDRSTAPTQQTTQTNETDNGTNTESSDRLQRVEEEVTVDPALLQENGTTDVVVRLREADTSFSTSRVSTMDTLKSHARETQKPVFRAADRMDGVEVTNRFWITNAVLLEVDLDRVDLRELARIEGVTRLHENFEVTLVDGQSSSGNETNSTSGNQTPDDGVPENGTAGPGDGTDSTENETTTTENETTTTADDGATSADNETTTTGNETSSEDEAATGEATPASYDVTYGLDQINATEVWNAYDTQGEGVTVAVLDTGVDPDHPDIDLYTEDPDDPTYPGGWANFTADGEVVPGSEPHDSGYHGTHTSGTIVGGNASGEYVGVAPEATLIHGQVLGGAPGTIARVAAGMEWAIEQDADLISMSLGTSNHDADMIEPVLNAESAGVLVVAAAGNEGEGVTGSPGNVYESFAIGAANENAGIADFSSGEVVHTPTDWGDAAPADWPDTYVVPDVSGPGVDVKSTEPGGSYQELSGTSMATPHVAGSVALMLSAADEELSTADIRSAFQTTAFKPENCQPSCSPRDGKDTRYGAGIVDVKRATDLVALDSGLNGTVTDEAGDPVADATVDAEGFATTTNADGEYDMGVLPGERDVVVRAFGYETVTDTANVTEGNVTTKDFTLPADVGARLTDGFLPAVENGDEVTATFTVANVETLTVEMSGSYSPDDADLEVDGTEYEFGETIEFDEAKSGELTVTVDTSYFATGNFTLNNSFEGAGGTTSLVTGPTEVFDEFTNVAVVEEPEGAYGDDVVETLNDELPLNYKVEELPSDSIVEPAEDGDYDVYVVQRFGDGATQSEIATFMEETDGPQTGVVYLDQKAQYSDGIEWRSQVTGSPASTHDGPFNDYTPVSYEVSTDHAVLDGVAGPGDAVEIHGVQYAHHTWFEGYDGRVLADVSDGVSTNGPGLGVDDTSRTVLAASLGRGFFSPDGLFSEDADRILANSVEWASTTPPVLFQDGQADHRAPTEEVSVELSVDQLEELTITLDDDATASAEDLTLYVDGNVSSFGQTLSYESRTDESFTVTVVPDDDVVGSVALDYEFVAGDDASTIPASTGPTAVYERPLDVPDDVGTLTEAAELAPEDAEIVLDDGTYKEQVSVDTAGVTVRAAEGASPVLHVPDEVAYDDPQYVLNLAADGVTLEGVEMDAEPDGFSFYAGSNLKVAGDNVTVDGVNVTHGDPGVELTGTRGTVITDSTVAEIDGWGATGIAGDSRGVLVDNVTVDGADTGIDITGVGESGTVVPGEVRVTNSTITDIRGDGFQAGASIKFQSGDEMGSIENNTIAGVAKGIVLDYADDVTVTGNEVTDADTAVQLDDGAESDRVAHNTIEDSAVGFLLQSAVNGGANVTMNDVDADTGVLVEGEYVSVAPDNIRLRYNDLSSTDVAIESDAEDGPLDARLNYLGDRGPATTSVEGDVVHDPFLTAHPDDVDLPESELDGTAQVATDLSMDAGEQYALGVPGPSAGTVSDVMGENFTGVVYGFQAESQDWTLMTGNDTVDALDALLVIPEADSRAVVSFHTDSSNPAGPGLKQLSEGWNFIAAPQYTGAGEAFGISSGELELALGIYEQPDGQLGPEGELDGSYEFDSPTAAPNVSAFSGYFIYSEEEGTIPSYVHGDVTMAELYEELDVNATVSAGTGSLTDAEVQAVVEAAASDAAEYAANRTDDEGEIEAAAQSAALAVAADLPVSVPKSTVEDAVETAVAEEPADSEEETDAETNATVTNRTATGA